MELDGMGTSKKYKDLRLENFRRMEQLTKTINLLEDIRDRVNKILKIPDDINKLVEEIKG